MKDDDGIIQQVLHLRDVEKLSMRQIARQMGIDRKRVRRIIGIKQETAVPMVKKNQLDKS